MPLRPQEPIARDRPATCRERAGRPTWQWGGFMALCWTFACGDDALALKGVQFESALASPIVAGIRSRPSDFPATGVILYHSDDPNSPMGAMLCSGTLVAPDVVLAAGHCQEHFGQENGPDVKYYFSLALDVSRFGPLVVQLPPDAVQVDYFLPHPDYDRAQTKTGLGRAADLGLFFLAAPVTDVPPATLPSPAAESPLKAGARVTIVGYGRRLTTALGSRDGGIKYQGSSTIHAVGPYEMHVGSGAQDALKCHGDSGGPTYMDILGPQGLESTLVGITSRALDWAGCMTGGVDTRVDAYQPWIAHSLAWACQANLRAACKP